MRASYNRIITNCEDKNRLRAEGEEGRGKPVEKEKVLEKNAVRKSGLCAL